MYDINTFAAASGSAKIASFKVLILCSCFDISISCKVACVSSDSKLNDGYPESNSPLSLSSLNGVSSTLSSSGAPIARSSSSSGSSKMFC